MNSTAEFEIILTLTDQIFRFAGYQIFDGLWDTKYRRLHRYFFLVLFGMVPIFPIQFLLQNFSTETLPLIVKDLICIAATIQAVFKMLFLHCCHNDLFMLFQTTREYRLKYLHDETCISLINRYTKVTKSVLRVTLRLYLVGVIVFLAFPLLSGGYREYALPYSFKLPFMKLDGIDYYLINYTYHIYVAVFVVVFVTGVDGLFLLSVTEACLQLDLLTKRLRTLGAQKDGNHLDPNYLTTFHYQHLDLLNYINSAKNVYANLVLIQLATDCLLLCTFMYTLARSDVMTELPAMIIYILIIMGQLFIYCICGQIMADKVHVLTTLMYDSEWYNLSLKDQKSLIIIMSRTQEEFYISAIGFNLSLKNFISVMKTAYSYYTIMRGMDA